MLDPIEVKNAVVTLDKEIYSFEVLPFPEGSGRYYRRTDKELIFLSNDKNKLMKFNRQEVNSFSFCNFDEFTSYNVDKKHTIFVTRKNQKINFECYEFTNGRIFEECDCGEIKFLAIDKNGKDVHTIYFIKNRFDLIKIENYKEL